MNPINTGKERFAIKGRYWDGENQRDGIIVIEQGRIVDILESNHSLSNSIEKSILPSDSLLIPGFIDVHTHMASYGVSKQRPNFSDTESLDDFLDRLREAVGTAREEVLIGEGFDQSRWKENRLPTKTELDRVAPDMPVIVRRVCGHLAVTNSKGLELFKDFSKGIDFEHGWLFEDVPLNLSKFFPPDFETIKLGILLAQEELLSMGITSIHEVGNPPQFKAYKELFEAGLLKIRVYFNFFEKYGKHLVNSGITTGFGNDHIKIGGIKFFLDGSVGAHTAAFFKKYKDANTRGKLNWNTVKLKEKLRFYHENGFQTLCHAIGDRAIAQVVNIWKEILQGGNYLRHRIEHFEFPSIKEIQLSSRLGLLVSMQPNFAYRWGGPGQLYDLHLQSDIAHMNNPFADVINEGLRMGFGSDGMPYGPIYGLIGAVQHPVPKSRINLKTALRLYTERSAHLSFDEVIKGKIARNYFADLIVLSPNPFEVDLVDVKVTHVWVNGKLVFPNSDSIKIPSWR